MTQIVRMSGAKGEGLEMKKYEEILFPNLDTCDPLQGARNMEEFVYKKGDIVLCTYPKCGTHWMVSLLWKLKSLDQTGRPRDTNLEYGPTEGFEYQNEPRIIHTHMKPSRLYPDHIENKGKVVLMLRNPKDIAVSYYCHLKDAVAFKSKQTWDEYFLSFVQGELPWGSYFDYLREWEQVLKEVSMGTRNLQVKVFYFEEFLFQPKENIGRLNEYLGFGRDEEYLDQVLSGSSFQALRERYSSELLAHEVCCNDTGNSIIFRKGQIGDWKNHLTVTQSEAIDRKLEEILQRGIIKFRFEA